jgi:hypothetical protein
MCEAARTDSATDILDLKLQSSPLLATDNRVIVSVGFGGTSHVLIDGVITRLESEPSEPGRSKFTITGVDLTDLMDRRERTVEHTAQPDFVVVLKLLARYAWLGIIPLVIPPLSLDFPSPLDRIPVQRGTDLQHIQKLAERAGYVFYLRPGPAPRTNVAYFGPPLRAGLPQRALSVNVGSETNVTSISFKYDPDKASVVFGFVKDKDLGIPLPIVTFRSLRLPPLASRPALKFGPGTRVKAPAQTDGLSWFQAFARAQAFTNKSTDDALVATGELDGARYGSVLRARGLVGVRGAGYSYDGLYYVKEVTHQVARGEYKQRFTLSREGLGSTVSRVRT